MTAKGIELICDSKIQSAIESYFKDDDEVKFHKTCADARNERNLKLKEFYKLNPAESRRELV